MSSAQRLVYFRKFKNWFPIEVAKEIGLSLELYLEFEEGKAPITDVLADKFSILFQAPKEIFIDEKPLGDMKAEVIYSNCTFVSKSGPSSGYVNNQYNDRGIDEILFSKNEEIRRLQDQINELRKAVRD